MILAGVVRESEPSAGRVMAGLSLAVLDVARDAGVSLDDVLGSFGGTVEALSRSDSYVCVELHEALWAEGARRTGDPHFSIRAAHAIKPGQTGVVEYILRNCATLEDAALTWVRFAGVVSDLIEGALVEDGARLRLEWRLARPSSEGAAQWSVFAQARALHMMRDALSAPTLAPVEVWFRHDAPPSIEPLSEFFLAPIRFGQPCAALVWDRALRDRPLRWVDPVAKAALEARAERLRSELNEVAPELSAQVRATLRALLSEPRHDLRLTVVADRLRVSTRTLQARLSAEGSSFRALVEEVKSEAARRLFEEENVTVLEAARRLGFNDASALRRARRRWGEAQGASARKR